jgi:hypothetical protein
MIMRSKMALSWDFFFLCGLLVCNLHNVSELQLTCSNVSAIPLLSTAEYTSYRWSGKYRIMRPAVFVNRQLT